jgi:hypothetical protein
MKIGTISGAFAVDGNAEQLPPWKNSVLVSVTVMVVDFVGAGTNVLVEVNYRLD